MDAQYKIIGGDGREYGPVSLDELKSWIRDGRMAAATQTWREDLATWAPAATYSEFAGELGTPRFAPGIAQAAELAPVGFWARLAAYIVDAIIVSILFYAVWAAISAMTGWQIPAFPTASVVDLDTYMKAISDYFEKLMPVLVPNLVVGQLVKMIYEVSLNGRFGATLGKMAIGARIVRLDGSPIGYGTALLRWLAARVSDLLCYAGYLFIAFRPDKRALHDLMVGTKVVFKR